MKWRTAFDLFVDLRSKTCIYINPGRHAEVYITTAAVKCMSEQAV